MIKILTITLLLLIGVSCENDNLPKEPIEYSLKQLELGISFPPLANEEQITSIPNAEVNIHVNTENTLLIQTQSDVKKSILSDTQFVDTLHNWKTYHGSNHGIHFSIQYPSNWTFQEFRCNMHRVSFCTLRGNKESDCGQTCEMDSKVSPIYLNSYGFEADMDNYNTEKSLYRKEPRVLLTLEDEQYQSVFLDMASTLQIVNY